MTKFTWRDFLEGVGVASIVASLIFVGIQLRQSQSMGVAAEAIGWIEMMQGHRAFIAEHADVWQRACAGEPLDQAEKSQASMIYQAYAELAYMGFMVNRDSLTDISSDSIINRFAANLHRYPGFAAMAREGGAYAAEGIRANKEPIFEEVSIAIQERLAELQRIDPDPEYDLRWCGI